MFFLCESICPHIEKLLRQKKKLFFLRWWARGGWWWWWEVMVSARCCFFQNTSTQRCPFLRMPANHCPLSAARCKRLVYSETPLSLSAVCSQFCSVHCLDTTTTKLSGFFFSCHARTQGYLALFNSIIDEQQASKPSRERLCCKLKTNLRQVQSLTSPKLMMVLLLVLLFLIFLNSSEKKKKRASHQQQQLVMVLFIIRLSRWTLLCTPKSSSNRERKRKEVEEEEEKKNL